MEQAPPVLSQQPTRTSQQEDDTRWRVPGVGEGEEVGGSRVLLVNKAEVSFGATGAAMSLSFLSSVSLSLCFPSRSSSLGRTEL